MRLFRKIRDYLNKKYPVEFDPNPLFDAMDAMPGIDLEEYLQTLSPDQVDRYLNYKEVDSSKPFIEMGSTIVYAGNDHARLLSAMENDKMIFSNQHIIALILPQIGNPVLDIMENDIEDEIIVGASFRKVECLLRIKGDYD